MIQRILRKMKKFHPDFAAAKSHLSAIFGKIIDGKYAKEQDYVDSIERWIERWSDPLQATSSDQLEALVQLGKYMAVWLTIADTHKDVASAMKSLLRMPRLQHQ